MLKVVEDLIKNLNSEWNDEKHTREYLYLDDILSLLDEFRTIVTRTLDKPSNEKEVVMLNIMGSMHQMVYEILYSAIIGQRLVLNPLNRSIVENYIMLGFIDKNGEAAAKRYIAQSEILYQKFMLEYVELDDAQKIEVENVIEETRGKFPETKLNNSLKWTNFFTGKQKNANTNLEIVAKSISFDSHYDNLKMFHLQTHNSQGLAHLRNREEFDNYKVFSSKIMNSIHYLSESMKLLGDQFNLINVEYWELHNKIVNEYERLMMSKDQ